MYFYHDCVVNDLFALLMSCLIIPQNMVPINSPSELVLIINHHNIYIYIEVNDGKESDRVEKR